MSTESVTRLGSSSVLLADKTCFRRSCASLRRSKSQRMKAFDGKPFATLEYKPKKSTNESDLMGQLYAPGKFDTSALNLEGPLEESAQRSSNLNSAVLDAPVKASLQKENEERLKRLQDLAVLRQGRFLGDDNIFRQTFVIRSYEVGSDGTTPMATIVSFFQALVGRHPLFADSINVSRSMYHFAEEVAINHFSLVGIGGEGFGATPKMNLYHLIWVITRLHVEVERYPTWPEAVHIDSWTDAAGKHGLQVNWLLREHDTEKIIARGTSTFAVMNQDTRRLSKLPDDVRVEIGATFIKTDKSAISESTVERIPKLDSTTKNIKSNLRPCKTDFDGNYHVNNVTYIRWVMESIPTQTWDSHNLSSITLEYRRECNKQDVVESLTDIEQQEIGSSAGSPQLEKSSAIAGRPQNGNGSAPYTNGNAQCQSSSVMANDSVMAYRSDIHFIHLLRTQSKAEEIVRSRTVWQRK